VTGLRIEGVHVLIGIMHCMRTGRSDSSSCHLSQNSRCVCPSCGPALCLRPT
jgi:hypothetical protein